MSEQPTLHNFVPNEIMFLFEDHDARAVLDSSEINTFLSNALDRLIEEKECPKAAIFKNFEIQEDYNTQGNDETRRDYFEPPRVKGKISGPALYVIQATIPTVNDDDLMEGVYAIFQTRGDAHYLVGGDRDRLRLVAITPNWLMTGSPNEPPVPADSGGGGGGPGGKPVSPQPAIPSFHEPWDVNAPTNFRLIPPPTPATQAPAGLNRSQLDFIAGLFDIPLGNPIAPREIELISDICYSTIDHALRTRMLPKKPAHHQKKIKVVILDSAPPRTTPQNPPLSILGLVEAYDRWGRTNANPLLRSLLQRNGNAPTTPDKPDGTKCLEADLFKITYYPPFDEDGVPYEPGTWNLKRACQLDQNRRDWVMDHGLFIAGIIHTLAPSVEIHLIEVLNAYGCGTLASYVHGLSLARQEFKPDEEILVVNMSFTFPIALEPKHPKEWLKEMDKDIKKTSDKNQNEWGPAMQAFLIYLTLPMQFANASIALPSGISKSDFTRILDIYTRAGEITQEGGIVVAAAGNNGIANQARPAACAPAAFSTVLGVAALKPNSQNFTDYSNNADFPPYNGLAVFGGDNQTNRNELSDPENGLLGLYIGSYPPPTTTANTTGWARWSGTSFAAPIITGVLAEMLHQDWSIQAALSMVRLAFGEPSGQADRFKIKQG